jgi:hypothetical protein
MSFEMLETTSLALRPQTRAKDFFVTQFYPIEALEAAVSPHLCYALNNFSFA